eukprot:6949593-Pyramimonas_sp.AAC.1
MLSEPTCAPAETSARACATTSAPREGPAAATAAKPASTGSPPLDKRSSCVVNGSRACFFWGRRTLTPRPLICTGTPSTPRTSLVTR